ncbi:CaiB/BaiF CoA transferase family protein [Tunturiibacter gelidoferens]|uniref:Crotonobetainyl-CoA:carnitine CoA-transferase CaiB-like acyl-CoA transferase n=1 Tax=Tunturiibacter gelidiferens TaxID=3069689 RepID=A0ACC5P028_9BACT|nr:CoA transferase [Edaphobacter lichenicola]MBB5340177.1 crotonobetainyl-CoA:carnitine CoA-transferase CaiB-like acyl-CoA transferase [Edaphobacter lichenicola]
MFNRIEFTAGPGGPLHGIRILDLSRLVAGNTLTMVLADLGADVIKIEPPGGDTLREWRVAGVETAWKTYSRNKRSLCLNLRDEGSRDILLRLTTEADVMVESFRPGTLEKMNLAPTTLFTANPKLVLARISGWGQTGPYAERPGFGTLVEGMSGFASMNGFADREPVLPPIYLGDMTAGLYGAIGILSALRHVEVNQGEGQVIDIPLLDPLFSILGAQAANHRLTGVVKPRTGSRSTNSAPRNVYRTLDEHWICLSGSTQKMAEKIFRAINRPELITDPRFSTNENRLHNVVELDRIIASFILTLNQQECLDLFQKNGVTVGPIYDMSDIEHDPHFRARQIVVELPDTDLGTIPVHTISPRLSATPGRFRRAAPHLGEDTHDVLGEIGYTDSAIAGFISSGLVKMPDKPGRDKQ